MFKSKQKKMNTPVNPSLLYKSGVEGVFITRTCYHDACYHNTLCLHARSPEIPLLKSQNWVYRGIHYFSYVSSKIKVEILSSTYNLLSEKMLENITCFYLKIVTFVAVKSQFNA